MSPLLTSQSLPGIIDGVAKTFERVDRELALLPDVPRGNLSLEVHNKVVSLANKVRQQFTGGSANTLFYSDWHAEAKIFRRDLLNTHPILHYEDDNALSMNSVQETIEILSEEEDVTPTRPSKRIKVDPKTNPVTPQRQSKLANIPLYRPEITPSRHTQDQLKVYTSRFTPNEIEKRIDDVNTGLPGARDPKVTENMWADSIKHWSRLLSIFLNWTQKSCIAIVDQQLNDVFAIWKDTGLMVNVRTIVKKFLDDAINEQIQIAKRHLRWEMQKIMTLDKENKFRVEKHVLDNLQNMHRRRRVLEWAARVEKRSGKPGSDANRKTVTDADLGPDRYSQVIEELAVS